MTSVYFFLDTGYLTFHARGEALDQLGAKIEALRSENHYEARQLVRADFRSFDRQADDLAVVTVRETWQDKLLEFDQYPGDSGEAPVSERGPYTLDVTYTLQREESGWKVIRAVYASEPPVW
ncbi:MAG: hypothetical protein ACOYEW_03640 [Anaerolineae bacterium]